MDYIIPKAKVLYLISGRDRFGMLAYLTLNPMLEINIIFCLPSCNYSSPPTHYCGFFYLFIFVNSTQ